MPCFPSLWTGSLNRALFFDRAVHWQSQNDCFCRTGSKSQSPFDCFLGIPFNWQSSNDCLNDCPLRSFFDSKTRSQYHIKETLTVDEKIIVLWRDVWKDVYQQTASTLSHVHDIQCDQFGLLCFKTNRYLSVNIDTSCR